MTEVFKNEVNYFVKPTLILGSFLKLGEVQEVFLGTGFTKT